MEGLAKYQLKLPVAVVLGASLLAYTVESGTDPMAYAAATVVSPIDQAAQPTPPSTEVVLDSYAQELGAAKLSSLAMSNKVVLIKTASPSAKDTKPNTTAKYSAASHYSPQRANWLYKLGLCESGNNPKINTGNGYSGTYQFSPPTWNSLHTGYKYAYLAPPSVQDAAIIANTLRSSDGLASQNPGCYASQHLSKFPPK